MLVNASLMQTTQARRCNAEHSSLEYSYESLRTLYSVFSTCRLF